MPLLKIQDKTYNIPMIKLMFSYVGFEYFIIIQMLVVKFPSQNQRSINTYHVFIDKKFILYF